MFVIVNLKTCHVGDDKSSGVRPNLHCYTCKPDAMFSRSIAMTLIRVCPSTRPQNIQVFLARTIGTNDVTIAASCSIPWAYYMSELFYLRLTEES